MHVPMLHLNAKDCGLSYVDQLRPVLCRYLSASHHCGSAFSLCIRVKTANLNGPTKSITFHQSPHRRQPAYNSATPTTALLLHQRYSYTSLRRPTVSKKPLMIEFIHAHKPFGPDARRGTLLHNKIPKRTPHFLDCDYARSHSQVTDDRPEEPSSDLWASLKDEALPVQLHSIDVSQRKAEAVRRRPWAIPMGLVCPRDMCRLDPCYQGRHEDGQPVEHTRPEAVTTLCVAPVIK
ncbi:hypothetical protein CSUB01_00809 [Colletotrichum sublineola]|uniref:Uncharacterized protein n=1 Tax=Colletotrichum sublineola TaxID=1173701 RepID=A0A066WW57_COLSU|nr:hypothetical protein CSUB01_00809 [Colletotrichum sublineola]